MFVTCALSLEPREQSASHPRRSGEGPTVDIHCHVMTPEADRLVEQAYSREEIIAHEPYDLYAGAASAAHNRSLTPALHPKLTDPAQRLRDMDRMGVDVQVLSTFVSQFRYWTDADLGQQIARVQNERLAEIVEADPARFAALGTVPLQDCRRAIAELEYVVERLGFRGVQISSNVDGADLDDPRFRPFFARAAQLGVVVLIHPNGFDQGRRLDDFYLINVIGNPLDSTLAVTRLIFAGVLAELPDLKLCVVHGGGYLPISSARMDHAYEVRPECRKHIDAAPSTYLRRVHFDTMVFTAQSLRNLIDFAGPEHVLLGTDYPFDMGEPDPLGLISGAGLGAEDTARIRGGNAVRLFGLDQGSGHGPA